jgi:hypothetical protein
MSSRGKVKVKGKNKAIVKQEVIVEVRVATGVSCIGTFIMIYLVENICRNGKNNGIFLLREGFQHTKPKTTRIVQWEGLVILIESKNKKYSQYQTQTKQQNGLNKNWTGNMTIFHSKYT